MEQRLNQLDRLDYFHVKQADLAKKLVKWSLETASIGRIVTDSMGNLLAISVHAANIHDTKGGVSTFKKALFCYPTIIGVCADSAYKNHFKNLLEQTHHLKADISKRLTSTFQAIPKRWRVERTFA